MFSATFLRAKNEFYKTSQEIFIEQSVNHIVKYFYLDNTFFITGHGRDKE
jgi:hypothetical protein